MSRVITFSRGYPAYHPKKGEPTYFVESIWKGLDKIGLIGDKLDTCINNYYKTTGGILSYNKSMCKYHTIRAGNRWKVGDKFSPRVWSDKPYKSKQIIISPDIQLKSVQNIRIETDKDYTCILIDEYPFFEENSNFVTQIEAFKTLAKNDGLSLQDLKDWFKYPKNFNGQILCWNENITY